MAKAGFWLRGAKGKIAGAVVQGASVGTIQRELVAPANPNTDNQIAQRAKFKLMSQVGAVLNPVLVIQKENGLSPRNIFVKLNFPEVSYAGGEALVTYENLQITNSNKGLPGIVATRSNEDGIQLQLAEEKTNISRVVYVAFTKSSEGQFDYYKSVIAEARGDNATWPATLPYRAGDIVIYAYGIIDNNAQATAKYGNYEVNNAQDFAHLLVNKKLAASDYQFTRTRGTTLYADESQTSQPETGQARVYVTAVGGGTVSGGGTFEIGTQVTVTATANEGYVFDGWFKQSQGAGSMRVSTSATYQFTLAGQTDLQAHFNLIDPNNDVDD